MGEKKGCKTQEITRYLCNRMLVNFRCRLRFKNPITTRCGCGTPVETECNTFQEFIVRNTRKCIGGIRTGFQNTWFVQGPNLNHLHVKQCTSWWFQPFFLLFSSWLTSFEQVPSSITSAWTCMKVHRKRFGHVWTYVLKMYEYQIPGTKSPNRHSERRWLSLLLVMVAVLVTLD